MSSTQTITALWEKTFGWNALNENDDGQTFFSISGTESPPLTPSLSSSAHGVQLGARIGAGGFADVFSAHQHALCREVAVKQIRAHDRPELLRLFHHEVWLTAGLNHPNILPIHDLIRIDGRPSLVMKRVNGLSWAAVLQAARKQETFVLHHEVQRLVDVCDAVAFAHSNGVLHLDLKPANVMCGSYCETLVMDWGCAAIFDVNLWKHHPDAPQTQYICAPFGTPAFMSPEQARGDGPRLGVHTDIYLLGAILHMLLSNGEFRTRGTPRDTIQLAAQGQRLPVPETAPKQLAQLCRHATEADIHDRLSDLSVFRSTLQHWLDTRESQVLTQKALEALNTMEQSAKLTAAQQQEGTQLLGVFEQAGRSGMQLPQAIEGEWRMRRLLAQNAIRNGDPSVARALAIPLPDAQRAIIQKQAQERQAQQTHAMGSHDWIGDALSTDGGRRAEKSLLRIVNEQRETLGEMHPSTLTSKEHIAALHHRQGKLPSAAERYQALVSIYTNTLGAEHSATLDAMHSLATVYQEQGKYQPAAELLKQVMETHLQTLGFEHIKTLRSLRSLADSCSQQGQYDEAESLYLRTLNAQQRTVGTAHTDTLESRYKLAQLYTKQGRYAEAENLFQQLIDVHQHTLHDEHPDRIKVLTSLANLYLHTGSYTEAKPLFVQAIAVQEKNLGPDHPDTLDSISNLASTLTLQGQHAEGKPLLLRALEARERTLGPEHPDTLYSISSLANVLRLQGRYTEAKPLYLRALEARERTLGPEHPHTLMSANNLAVFHNTLRQPHEAESLYMRVLEVRERTLGPNHPHTFSSINNLAATYHALSRYDEAEVLFVRALHGRERILGADHPETLVSLNNLAMTHVDQGRLEDAEPLYAKAMAAQERVLGPEHPHTLFTLSNLARLYGTQGKVTEAESLYEKVIDVYQRTEGDEHPQTLSNINNLAWLQLKATDTVPRPAFQHLLSIRTSPQDVKHHWARMGLALCTLKETGGHTDADAVIQDMIELLGAADEAIVQARTVRDEVSETFGTKTHTP